MTDVLTTYWPMLLVLAQGVFGWLLWSMRRAFVTRADCASCRGQVDSILERQAQCMESMERRLAAYDADLRCVPSSADHRSLELLLSKMEGNVAVLDQRLQGLGDSMARFEKVLDRQEEFLMGQR